MMLRKHEPDHSPDCRQWSSFASGGATSVPALPPISDGQYGNRKTWPAGEPMTRQTARRRRRRSRRWPVRAPLPPASRRRRRCGVLHRVEFPAAVPGSAPRNVGRWFQKTSVTGACARNICSSARLRQGAALVRRPYDVDLVALCRFAGRRCGVGRFENLPQLVRFHRARLKTADRTHAVSPPQRSPCLIVTPRGGEEVRPRARFALGLQIQVGELARPYLDEGRGGDHRGVVVERPGWG